MLIRKGNYLEITRLLIDSSSTFLFTVSAEKYFSLFHDINCRLLHHRLYINSFLTMRGCLFYQQCLLLSVLFPVALKFKYSVGLKFYFKISFSTFYILPFHIKDPVDSMIHFYYVLFLSNPEFYFQSWTTRNFSKVYKTKNVYQFPASNIQIMLP